ncbi:MAG: Gfo/Idh/MocA family oxidoreductase [Candidatus Thorarchaeota archaeon]
MSTSRIGLIGTGNIGRTHLTSLASLRHSGLLDVDITAVCDIDEDAMQQAAELFDVPVTFKDFKDLIADETVDIVYICAPTNKHGSMVKAAAKAKKPLFCEKPLARSWPQASELMGVTKDAGVSSGVGLVLRYDQFLLHAKKLMETNDFGQPMLAHIRDDQRFPVDYVQYSKWRGTRSVAGGGTLIEHSIHDIDVLGWFFGTIESVYARINYFAGKEVEDQASLVLTHEGGAVSTLDSIWHWVERPNERMIELFFEKGVISIRLESGKRVLDYQLQGAGPVRVWEETANLTLLETLGVHSKNLPVESVETLTSVGAERYAALSYAFLKSVQSGTEPSPSFRDAVTAHKVVDAAYDSANKNQCVDLL